MPKYECLIIFTKNIKVKLEKYQKSIQKTARKLVNSFKDAVVRNILDRIRKAIVSMNRTKKVIIDFIKTKSNRIRLIKNHFLKILYKFYTDHKIITILIIIAFFFCLFFIFIYKTQEENNPELMNFFYAISISIIAASIFYVFNVYLPERKRKDIIKHNFKEEYIYFKKYSIAIFLSLLGESSNAKIEEKLCDLSEFKKYFKEKCDSGQERWYKVWGELNRNTLKNLLVGLDILRDELFFMLNNIEINDEKVLSLFKLLSQSVYRYRAKGINMDYEEKKALLRFLWQLFLGWSFVDGYRKDDIVMLMIEKI